MTTCWTVPCRGGAARPATTARLRPGASHLRRSKPNSKLASARRSGWADTDASSDRKRLERPPPDPPATVQIRAGNCSNTRRQLFKYGPDKSLPGVSRSVSCVCVCVRERERERERETETEGEVLRDSQTLASPRLSPRARILTCRAPPLASRLVPVHFDCPTRVSSRVSRPRASPLACRSVSLPADPRPAPRCRWRISESGPQLLMYGPKKLFEIGYPSPGLGRSAGALRRGRHERDVTPSTDAQGTPEASPTHA